MNAFFVALMVRFAPPVVAAISLMVMGLGIMAYAQVDSVFVLALYSLVWECGFSLLDSDGAVDGVAFFARGQEGKMVGAVAKRE